MSTKKYAFSLPDFKYEGSNPVNPQRIGEELEGIPDLTPKKVVDYGKAHPQSEVAKFLEWNDPTAAYLFRYQMAERLIRHLVVVAVSQESPKSEPLTIKVQAYQQDRVGGTYSPTETIPSKARIKTGPTATVPRLLSQVDSLINQVNLYRSDLGLSPAAIEHLAVLKKELESIVAQHQLPDVTKAV